MLRTGSHQTLLLAHRLAAEAGVSRTQSATCLGRMGARRSNALKLEAAQLHHELNNAEGWPEADSSPEKSALGVGRQQVAGEGRARHGGHHEAGEDHAVRDGLPSG